MNDPLTSDTESYLGMDRDEMRELLRERDAEIERLREKWIKALEQVPAESSHE